ncbi:MAG TPA: shikimate dehydrogenase [Candidatus Acidoferrales bacterium]|jgi:shikimate dehydrogenase|nr:shikimate dehydrogenase [Candidatus Acidoferrales bacterium]
MAVTTVYAVLGSPIGHSLSPAMHNAAFRALSLNATYYAFDVDAKRAETAIRGALALGFGGLNVTFPLKEIALRHCSPDAMARGIGAVNTIDRAGTGYNTDGVGAVRALEEAGIEVKDTSVLLLGAGGAAKAISAQLLVKGARVAIANRTVSRSLVLARQLIAANFDYGCGGVEAHDLAQIDRLLPEARVLINATTVGMRGVLGGQTLVKASQMHPKLIVFDIVYDPIETPLLREAKAAGLQTIDGVKMLVHQGAASFALWTSEDPPVQIMEAAAREVLRRERAEKPEVR